MQTWSTDDIRALVQPKRVHRKVYLDEDLFELEMQRVFGRAWIFIGHDSQVPNPGDYITAMIGRQPVVMIREWGGDAIHVLHNRCAHKGAMLVTKPAGNIRSFRCCYHGWAFKTNGKLISTPHAEGYENTGFDRDDPINSMQLVARMESYRGFVFASLAAEGPDLRSYLGETAVSIDNMIDRSPEGALEMAGGVLRFRHPSNWKTFVENLNDAMHPMVAHYSVGEACKAYADSLPEGTPPPKVAEIISPFGSSYDWFDKMGVTACRYGNGFTGGKVSIHSAYSDVPGYMEAMHKAYGEERTQEILSVNRHNTIFYPSLTIKGAIQAIRVVRPISVNETDIDTYTFRLKGAPEEMFHRTILYSRLINSPASMVAQDDLEAYNRIQRGLESEASDWVDMHRHFGREPGEGREDVTTLGTSDISFRNQYRAWTDYMTGEAA